jgi:hypothetical protein
MDPRLTDEEASRKYSDDLVRFDSVFVQGGSRGTYIYDDFVSLYDCSTGEWGDHTWPQWSDEPGGL